MTKRLFDSSVGLESDYDRQAQDDFANWDLLERADLLPPPGQVPTRRLINRAKRILGLPIGHRLSSRVRQSRKSSQS